jgi:hypothetical protein
VSPHTASYSAPLVTLALVLVIGTAVWLARLRRIKRIRRCDPWDCGFAAPSARMQYSATAFAQPIRQVFALLFRIEETLDTQADGSRRYQLQVHDRAWALFYLPVVRAVEAAARRVSRLQSGNVRIYLGWSFATLLVLLWIIS